MVAIFVWAHSFPENQYKLLSMKVSAKCINVNVMDDANSLLKVL